MEPDAIGSPNLETRPRQSLSEAAETSQSEVDVTLAEPAPRTLPSSAGGSRIAWRFDFVLVGLTVFMLACLRRLLTWSGG